MRSIWIQIKPWYETGSVFLTLLQRLVKAEPKVTHSFARFMNYIWLVYKYMQKASEHSKFHIGEKIFYSNSYSPWKTYQTSNRELHLENLCLKFMSIKWFRTKMQIHWFPEDNTCILLIVMIVKFYLYVLKSSTIKRLNESLEFQSAYFINNAEQNRNPDRKQRRWPILSDDLGP